MKIDGKLDYLSPQMSVMSFSAETGFAVSGENHWFRDESNSANIGWEYSADDEIWS